MGWGEVATDAGAFGMLIFCWLTFGLFVLVIEFWIAAAVPESGLFSRPLSRVRLRLVHLTIVTALVALDLGLLGPFTRTTLGMSPEVGYVCDACFVLSVFALRLHPRMTFMGWLISAYVLAVLYMIALSNAESLLGR